MTTETNYKASIKSLPKKQREALDQICCENDSGHHPKTLTALVDKGLIERFEQKDGAFTTYRYSVTWSVHIDWCAVCAEENPDELEAIA